VIRRTGGWAAVYRKTPQFRYLTFLQQPLLREKAKITISQTPRGVDTKTGYIHVTYSRLRGNILDDTIPLAIRSYFSYHIKDVG